MEEINSTPENLKLCILCEQPSNLVSVPEMKKRYLRLIQHKYPDKDFDDESKICLSHLQDILYSRVDDLLQEDLTEFSKFQDDIMKNLQTYEIGENHWQAQFEKDRSFGERCADTVAKFGGSWFFLMSLFSWLFIWSSFNLLLDSKLFKVSHAWDPYPFILLNLFLSAIAATQAPVIMMSQNRQAKIDKSQTDFISQAILRNENQTNHVDAKLDHLISYQWKRLLEIQEIQIQLLKGVVNSVEEPPKMTRPEFWNAESNPDEFTRLLLRHYYECPKTRDVLIFSHWHEDGDNFTGELQDIEIESKSDNLLKIQFSLKFANQATLDDIFSGEANYESSGPYSVDNNFWRNYKDNRERYKPTFVRHRPDRVTDAWKQKFDLINIVYVPLPLVAVLHVPINFKLTHVSATTFGESCPFNLNYKQVLSQDFKLSSYLQDLTDQPKWDTGLCIQRSHEVGHVPTYDIEFDVIGPAVLMFTSDKRIGWQALLEKNDDTKRNSFLHLLNT